MNPRTTGILFLVAAALAAFLYFYEVRGGQSRREAEEQAKRIFPEIDEEDIEVIRLTGSDGVPMRAQRTEGGWRLTEPLVFPGDPIVLDGMASTLAQLASEDVIDSPQSPEVYGLDREERVVRFTASGTERVLRVGNETPVGSNSYLSADDRPEVYTVATYRTRSLLRPLLEVREKRILRFDRASIERIEARWASGGVTLGRQDGGWRVVAPIEDAADSDTVEALLSDLSFLLAEGFLDEPPPDAEVGLDRPEFAVELKAADGPEGEGPRFRLAIGGLLDEETRVARGGQKALYKIDPARLADFPRELAAYRFKELARFVATDATSLEMVFHPREGAPLTVRAERGEDGWTTSPQTMETGKVSRLVAELARLRGEDILADSMGPAELHGLGLSPPRALFRVWSEDGDPLAEVHLGDVDPEKGVIARSADAPRVYRIAYDLAEHLPVSLDAFRNRFVEPADDEADADAPEGQGGADLVSEELIDDPAETP